MATILNRRRLLYLSLAAVAVGLGVGVWTLRPRTAITRENAAKIEQGMTLAKVEAIMGGPPRDESTGAPLVADEPDERDVVPPTPRLLRRARVRLLRFGEHGLEWRSDEVTLSVFTDADGCVADYSDMYTRCGHEGTLHWLRRWLGYPDDRGQPPPP